MTAPSLAPGIDPGRLEWVRVQAGWHLDQAGGDAYMTATMEAVLDTVAWLEGAGPAPLSGEKLAANEAGLAMEESRAEDQEREARGAAAWRPGRVLLVLAYLAGDPVAESPV